MTIEQQIQDWKRERDAVILAHYYVAPEVQEIADYVGDSFYLSKVALDLPQQTIVFCGVAFMGESAKLLNEKKTVLMPDLEADCPMAHMAQPEEIRKIREREEDLAVVCYINSTAALKACAGEGVPLPSGLLSGPPGDPPVRGARPQGGPSGGAGAGPSGVSGRIAVPCGLCGQHQRDHPLCRRT